MPNLYNLKSVVTQLFCKREMFYIVEMQGNYLLNDNFLTNPKEKTWQYILKKHLYTSAYGKL